MIIELRTESGYVILSVDTDLPKDNLELDTNFGIEVYTIPFERLEAFALELTRALGHDWDKTIR